MANYLKGHRSEMGPPQKKFFHKFTCCYTSVPIYGSKFWNLGGQKNLTTFWPLRNPKKSALFSPANGQSVTYSKIQTRVCRVPWGPPMDWFLIKSVNAEYPLSCCKCVEKWTFCIQCPTGSPKCVAPPQKWYHHIAYVPAHLQTWETLMPHRSFIEKKLIFWRHLFLANYLNGPGVAKNWHMSKLTKKGPRRCHKVSWAQIWQKNSNGKCLKLPKRNSRTPCY